MCGRSASTSSRRDLLSAFEATKAVGEELPPSYNIAPTKRVDVVLEGSPSDEPGVDPVRQVKQHGEVGPFTGLRIGSVDARCNSSKDDETISVAVGSASSLPPNRLTS